VQKYQDLVDADPEAKRAYDDHLWGLTEAGEGVAVPRCRWIVCKHTNPAPKTWNNFIATGESG
jgi:hypothetical protein